MSGSAGWQIGSVNLWSHVKSSGTLWLTGLVSRCDSWIMADCGGNGNDARSGKVG